MLSDFSWSKESFLRVARMEVEYIVVDSVRLEDVPAGVFTSYSDVKFVVCKPHTFEVSIGDDDSLRCTSFRFVVVLISQIWLESWMNVHIDDSLDWHESEHYCIGFVDSVVEEIRFLRISLDVSNLDETSFTVWPFWCSVSMSECSPRYNSIFFMLDNLT